MLDTKPATGARRGQTNAPGGGLSFRPFILAAFTTAKNDQRETRRQVGKAGVRKALDPVYQDVAKPLQVVRSFSAEGSRTPGRRGISAMP